MSKNTILEKGTAIAREACELDSQKKWKEAKMKYLTSIEWLAKAKKHEKNPSSKEMIEGKIKEYLKRAEQLQQFLTKTDIEETNQSKNGNLESSQDRELKAALESSIIFKTNVSFEDVAGLDDAKEALEEAVLAPLHLPEFFHGNRTPWRGILLYGPPGTGKSYIAKAIATEADNSCFISVSSSDLVSKWQGQSERTVASLFDLARERKPCIIFIDEVDSLCRARSDEESESSRRIKTTFLTEMQGVNSDNEGILVVGATNTPWELDSAIRRRFEKRIYIPLPDVAARTAMFKLHLHGIKHDLTDQDYQQLALRSEGYSGADINTVCRDAIMQPVRKTTSASYFKMADTDDGDAWQACSQGAPGAVEATWRQIKAKGHKFVEIPVTKRDVDAALARTKPTLAQKDLDRIEEFTREYGQDQ